MTNLFNIYKPLIASVLFVLMTSSCEKEIDVDLRSVSPRMQIEGMVPEGMLAKVRVSHTIDFSDNSGYPFLEGAIVKISDDAGNSEILQQNETGWYVAKDLIGVEGRTYNMSVIYEDEEYTATSKINPQVKLDSVTMYKILAMDYALPMVHFTDPVGTDNQYYRFLLYFDGAQRTDIDEIVVSAEHTDGSPLHVILPVFSENDDADDPIQQGTEITVEIQCLDFGSYTFFEDLSNITNSLTNPGSNISNGALGVFYAYSYHSMSIVAEWKE